MPMNYYRQLDRWLSERFTPAVKTIFVINVGVFIVLLILGLFSRDLRDLLIVIFGENANLSLRRGMIWQFLTYMFIHVDPIHLLFNMLILYFFGRELEYRWGRFNFWVFYLVTGIGAGLLHGIIGALTGAETSAPMIGASGALFGILLAYGAYFPNQTVLVYFLFPIQMKYLVALLIFLEVALVNRQDNISRITHLSGLVIAYLYLTRYHRTADIRKWRYLR
jgi:membrane associated rhomboid family serine protease